MDKEFLQDYCQKEIEHCEEVFQSEQFASASTKEKLRLLYDVPADAEAYYCETGGLENLDNFPEDKLIVLTIFPYRQKSDFNEHLGSLDSFLEKCRQTNRIIPVVQSPLYYDKLDHLEPFFTEIKSRSFFARGPYAYAAIKGGGLPKLVTNKYGHPSLIRIKELEERCQTKHAQWLAHAIRDRKCWEPRYRRDGTKMYENTVKLSSSFVYRYASVAYWIGQELTDDIILAFEHQKACAILLRLHILFDHVVANGFGSHFCADPCAVEYRNMCQPWTSLLSPIERVLCKDLKFPVMGEFDEDYKELLKYHHPLEGIHVDNLGLSQIEEAADRIGTQFEQFRKKVERLRTKKRITKRVFSISLFLLGSLTLLKGDLLLGSGIAGTGLVGEKVFPKWLYEGTFEALERLYRHNLGCFLLSSKWE